MPETGPSGAPVLDGGAPACGARTAGPPTVASGSSCSTTFRTGLKLEAWDYAGNHTRVGRRAAGRRPPPLGAVWRESCEALAPALRVEASEEDTPSGGPVNALRPEKVVLQVGTSLRLSPEEQQLRLVVEPVEGGPSSELPLRAGAGHVNADIESFEGIGLDPTVTYRGRFRGRGDAGEVSSAPFVFSPCNQWLRAFTAISTRALDPKSFVIVQVSLDAAVIEVRAGLTLEPIRGVATPLGTLDLLPLDEATARRLFEIPLGGAGEAVFSHSCRRRDRNRAQPPPRDGARQGRRRGELPVRRGRGRLPEAVVPAGRVPLRSRRTSSSRAAPPRRTSSTRRPEVTSGTFAGARHDRGRAPQSPVVLDTFDFVSTPEKPDFFAATRYRSRATAGRLPAAGPGGPPLSVFLPVPTRPLRHRRPGPPVATFLLPPEGGSVCLARDNAAPPLATLALADDAAPRVEPSASWRRDGGPWSR